MAVICLVRPLLSPTEFNGYPLNLLILAAALRGAGHDVEICDFDYLKEIDASWLQGGFGERAARHVLARSPEFVGITAMCSNYVLALDLAEHLKVLAPSVHVTLGGPHVSLCARETLQRHPSIDSAVIGEGEVTYPELIDRIERGEDLAAVAGIAVRSEGGVVVTAKRPLMTALEASPRPAYDLVDIPSYLQAARGNYLELYAGSGCPFSCTFCSTSIVWERKYRTMPVDRLVDEMETLGACHGARAFNLVHDNLTANKLFVRQLAEEIRRRHLKIRWGFSSRIDTIDRETIQLVAAAGCDYIFFGVESGSSRIQKTMGKRLKLERIHQVTAWCAEHGIAPTTSFILGFPDEDLDDVGRTIRLAFRCRAMGARRSFINLLSPYTGTAVMKGGLAGMKFIPASINSTMVSFLEPHHYRQIQADPYLFSNYYALDYSGSPIGAGEYPDLVDFYTISLCRYRYTLTFMLDDLEVDPVGLFRSLRHRINVLDVEARNHLALELSLSELADHVAEEHRSMLAALLLFDHAVWETSRSRLRALLFSGPVRVGRPGAPAWVGPAEEPHHYLLSHLGEELYLTRLEPALSHLYELQGLPALRARGPAHDRPAGRAS